MTLPSLTLLFATVDAFALSLSMPAVTGHYAHPITARQPHCYLRYTNFAEGMAPLFRAEHIDDVFLPALRGLPADDPGWGVDTVSALPLRCCCVVCCVVVFDRVFVCVCAGVVAVAGLQEHCRDRCSGNVSHATAGRAGPQTRFDLQRH